MIYTTRWEVQREANPGAFLSFYADKPMGECLYFAVCAEYTMVNSLQQRWCGCGKLCMIMVHREDIHRNKERNI